MPENGCAFWTRAIGADDDLARTTGNVLFNYNGDT